MFGVKNPILYLFLLVLGVFFNFIIDVVYKRSRFPKVFTEKTLEIVLDKKIGSVTFDLGLVLLSVEIDHIPKK